MRASSVEYAADGKLIVCGTGDYYVVFGWIRILDPDSARLVREMKLPGGVDRVLSHPDGRHLVACNSNRTIYILRMTKR